MTRINPARQPHDQEPAASRIRVLPNASLRTRLSLIVVLALIPAGLFLLFDAMAIRQRSEREAEAELLRLGQFVTNSYTESVENARQLLAIVALDGDVERAAQGGDRTACTVRLAELSELTTGIIGFGLWDLDGSLICAQQIFTSTVSAGDRLWFQQARQSESFAIGNFQLSRPGNVAMLAFGYPVRDQSGTVKAILSTGWDLAALNQTSHWSNFPTDAVITIADATGTILFRNYDFERWMGQRQPASQLQTTLAQEQRVIESVGVDGVKRLYVFTAIPGPGGTQAWLSIGRTPSAVYAGVRQAIVRDLLGVGATLLAALAAIWFGSHKLILQPVGRLVRASRALATGELSARTGLPADASELGQLALSFDQMAAALQQRQEALLERERHLHLALQAGRMVAWTWNPTANRVETTDNFPEVYGVDAVEYAEQGFALIHCDDRERHQQIVAQAMAERLPYRSEFRIIRPDTGQIVWLDECAVPVIDAAGQLQKVAGVVIDITERKRAEETRRTSEAELRTMFNVTSVGMAQSDPATRRLLRVNEALCTITGYSEAELLAMTVDQLNHPDDREQDDERHQRLVRGESADYQSEKRYMRKDGSIVWVHVTGNLIYSDAGQPLRTVALIQDISERKAAEAALRASEARFRSVFTSNMTPMGVWTSEGAISEANEALLALLGYTRQELEQGRLNWRTLTVPDYLPLDEQALAEIAANGVCTPFEKEYIHKDGQRVPVLLGGGRFDEEAKRGVFFAVDLSEQRRAQAQVRESEEKYRTLFNSIDEGFCIIELIFDAQQRPIDYRFVQMNPAFSHLTGLEHAEGKTARELVPNLEDFWFETYGQVALTGEAVRFEHKSDSMQRWFDVYATRIGDAASRRVALVFRNTTERKLAEAELATANFRYRVAEEAAKGFNYEWDLATGLVTRSASSERVLGYGVDELPRTWQAWADLIHPDDRMAYSPVEAIAWINSRHQESFGNEYRVRHKAGHYLWVLERSLIIRDAEGHPRRLIGQAVDITERKQAEAALQHARDRAEQAANRVARLQQITALLANALNPEEVTQLMVRESTSALEASAGAIVLLSADGTDLALADVQGYPPEIVEAWRHFPLATPVPIADAARTGQVVLLESPQARKERYPHLHDRPRDSDNQAWASIPLMAEGRTVGALGLSFRTPRHFSAEEQELMLALSRLCAQALERAHLYAAEKLARAAADAAARASAALAERIGRLQTVTAAFGRALNAQEVNEVLLNEGVAGLGVKYQAIFMVSEDGQFLEDLQRWGERTALREAYRRIPLSLSLPVTDAFRTETALWLASQQQYLAAYPHLAEQIMALKAEAAAAIPLIFEGRATGVLALSFTGVKEFTADEQDFLLALAQQGAQALERARLYEAEQQARARLEVRVRERTAELERSNRELDQFAYVASHDLRSPLRGIEHLANFIVQDAADLLPEPSQRHLALIRSRIKRMEALLNDLLAYSRAGRHRYSPEPLDPAKLIHETVELLAPPEGFVVEVVEPLPQLIGERVPLEIIFRNLIGNAIKHHHQPSAGVVRIRALEQATEVAWAVADNGPGIDPAFHERIFEIFQTLKPRDHVEGSGIGLTMVKKMVETRGGAIWVESTPGEGTVFHFTWPKQSIG